MKFLLVIFVLVTNQSYAEETKSGLESYIEFQESQAADACRDIKVGETRVVLQRNPMRSTTLKSDEVDSIRYDLTRVADKKYKVVIPVTFVMGPEYDGSEVHVPGSQDVRDRLIDFNMRVRVKKCLSKMQQHLKDKNGFELQLAIDNTPEEAQLRKPGFKINMVKAGTRAHSRAYASDVDCPTIVHELLHLTGLQDEYSEREMTSGTAKDPQGRPIADPTIYRAPKFDCRTRPFSVASIMGKFDEIHHGAKESYRHIGTCKCESAPCTLNAADRERFPNGISIQDDVVYCPPGYKTFRVVRDIAPAVIGAAISTLKTDTPTYVDIYKKIIRPDSFLRPAHVRHIIYPGCQEKNRNFYRCAAHAQDTSLIDGCGLTYKKCREDESWLE